MISKDAVMEISAIVDQNDFVVLQSIFMVTLGKNILEDVLCCSICAAQQNCHLIRAVTKADPEESHCRDVMDSPTTHSVLSPFALFFLPM